MSSDENDFDPFSDDELPEQPKSKPASAMLRGSLIVAIIAGITIFLTAVTASNSPPNSAAENAAMAINTVARVALLAGFVGVLIAFRLSQIKNLVAGQFAGNWETEPTAPGQESSSMQTNAPLQIRAPSNDSIKADLRLLLVVSVVTVLFFWMVAFAVPSSWGGAVLVFSDAIQLILAAIFATLIFNTKGPLRGFAIGGFTVLLSSRFSSDGTFMALSGFGYSNYSFDQMSQTFLRQHATTLTISFIAALICACVVGVMEAAKAKNSSKT